MRLTVLGLKLGLVLAFGTIYAVTLLSFLLAFGVRGETELLGIIIGVALIVAPIVVVLLPKDHPRVKKFAEEVFAAFGLGFPQLLYLMGGVILSCSIFSMGIHLILITSIIEVIQLLLCYRLYYWAKSFKEQC